MAQVSIFATSDAQAWGTMNNHDTSIINGNLNLNLKLNFDDEPRSITEMGMDVVFQRVKPREARDRVEQNLDTATHDSGPTNYKNYKRSENKTSISHRNERFHTTEGAHGVLGEQGRTMAFSTPT